MINYIFGYVEMELHCIEAVSLLAQNNIRCSEIRKDNEKIVINVPLYSLRKVRKLLNEHDFSFETIKMKGIPSLFINCRTKYGMLFGITIFLAMIIFSGKYIWSFQVSGNSYISDEEIIGILDDLGCGVGTKINDIDFDKLHNRFLMECKDISWISVNMDGVIAKVEVLEVNRGKVDTEGFANIVASESGQIERITLVKGKPQVEIGDVVKKGELLISGVESYREGELTFYENADGAVFANVNRTIKAHVKKEKVVKNRTGNFMELKRLKIFNLNINLFGKGGNYYDEYDIITENRQIVLFGIVELPLWTVSEKIYELSDVVVSLSKTELEAEAIRLYQSLLKDTVSDCEIVSISTKRTVEEDSYTIESNINCITDIAERVPYEIISDNQKEE